MAKHATKQPDGDVPIDALLREMGFDTPAAVKRARGVIEHAGITNPRKHALSPPKVPLATAAIAAALVRVCGDECAALAKGARQTKGAAAATGTSREPVIVGGVTCEICGGSNNRRSALACIRVLKQQRVERVLVVGGSPKTRQELQGLLAEGGIELETVDGTVKHSQRDALHRMNRANVLVIWGATELDHAVSELYTQEPPPGLRVVKIGRRGVGALCDELRDSYQR